MTSNRNLSNDEKSIKLDLKKKLKQQIRLRKLVVRRAQALIRRETSLAEQTLLELESLYDEAPELRQEPSIYDLRHESYDQAIETIRLIHESLCEHLHGFDHDVAHRMAATLILQRHMKKGTQTAENFHDTAALHGYTRNKFHERASLIASSLGRLFLRTPVLMNRPLQETLVERMQCTKVVASIGCGPGCDAVGISAFFRSLSGGKLERAILMDWAIEQWRSVLRPLQDILVPSFIEVVSCSFCNVQLSLEAPENSVAKELLQEADVDLYVVSYLLSETRGKWDMFLRNLIHQSRVGALFLILDPTAWQLHLLIHQSALMCEWTWLDSSMFRPELQGLQGRVNSAVMIGIKKDEKSE